MYKRDAQLRYRIQEKKSPWHVVSTIYVHIPVKNYYLSIWTMKKFKTILCNATLVGNDRGQTFPVLQVCTHCKRDIGPLFHADFRSIMLRTTDSQLLHSVSIALRSETDKATAGSWNTYYGTTPYLPGRCVWGPLTTSVLWMREGVFSPRISWYIAPFILFLSQIINLD